METSTNKELLDKGYVKIGVVRYLEIWVDETQVKIRNSVSQRILFSGYFKNAKDSSKAGH